MTDVLTPDQRRLNMSRIGGRNTRLELVLRRGSHALGLRYRLQVPELPGRPDLVFPRYRAIILVHGCFWHGHDCPLFKLPATRADLWATKIAGNKARDARTMNALRATGWRVFTVWECSLRGRVRQPASEVLASCAAFVIGDIQWGTLAGNVHDSKAPQSLATSGDR
jgi:DNA mismatch endonuclease (patch repair protein)